LKRPFFLLLAIFVGASTGCRHHRATPAECKAILDRLVELELTESGYRDPVARARWQAEINRRFAADLERCAGLTVRENLDRCLSSAKGAEGIAHVCLE
jgi:hypothetical protein